jgi:hypothetical protein
MEYRAIREEAFEANIEIPRRGLAIYTWGNVSAFDPEKGVFAIKPSGVVYEELTPESMVVVDLEGKPLTGSSARHPIPKPTWYSTVIFPASGALPTPIRFTPSPGPRPCGAYPFTEPPTPTTVPRRFPARRL